MPILLFVAAFGAAAEPDASTQQSAFSEALSADEQAASGLTLLEPDEIAALDRKVAEEIALARDGDVRGFAGTFVSRRPDGERSAMGLDRLSDEQQERLSQHVAQRLALRSLTPFTLWPGYRGPAARPDEPVETSAPGLEIHSRISLSYGGGSGVRTHGGSMNVFIEDPKRRFSISVGYSEFHTEITREAPRPTNGSR